MLVHIEHLFLALKMIEIKTRFENNGRLFLRIFSILVNNSNHMPMTFHNKVAIVTGAAQGIGLEICRRLAKAGANVILNDIDAALATNAASAITLEQGNCIAVAGDASSGTVIQQLMDTALSHYGKLDIAIANAGITLFGDFLSYSREAFTRVMEVNMAGTFFLA